jgi:micrococcal nuclease
MFRWLGFIILVFLALFSSGQTGGRVVKVADGDTFTIVDLNGKTHKIRLYGIDCPELKQPFGAQAKSYTEKWVLGQTVSIQKISKDRNGRVVAKVTVNRINLNELLLKNGYAWHFTRYDNSVLYANLQQQAKTAKLGLWAASNPIAPWEWRKMKR